MYIYTIYSWLQLWSDRHIDMNTAQCPKCGKEERRVLVLS